MTFRLLSCDGGGIRGYISSTLISELDKATNQKFLSGIHGFAGTSTGGLISIALAAGVPIDTMVDIYKNNAADIFTENSWLAAQNAQRAQAMSLAAEAAQAGPGLFESEYTAEGLRTTIDGLTNAAGRKIGSMTFADLTDRMLVVNSAQLDDHTATPPRWMPATLNNQRVGADYSAFLLSDAALATSAAPTYFPPHRIAGYGYFADGGTYANNPVLNGVEVALSSGLAGALSEIEVLSFGTGQSPMLIPESAVGQPLDWGVTRWMWPRASGNVPAMALLNLTLSLSAENAGGVIQQLLGPQQMVRINPELDAAVPLDGYSVQDYDTMNRAIDKAMAGAAWQDAIALVSRW